jgi:hypothetical protein
MTKTPKWPMMISMGKRSWPVRLAVSIAAVILATCGFAVAGPNAKAVGPAVRASHISSVVPAQSGGVILISHTDGWAAAGLSGNFLHWNGKKWSPVQAPKATGENIIWLAGASAGSIWAVGYFVTPQGGAEPLVLHWNGKHWSRALGVPEVHGELDSVAVTGNDVWGVGGINGTTGFGPPLILHLTGGHWHVVPAAAPDGVLSGLAMTGRSSGWAGGFSAGTREMMLHWNGSRWQAVSSAAVANQTIATMAAGPSGQAWAIGENSAPFSMHWNGKSWTTAPFQFKGNAPSAAFTDVTFIPGGTAWLIGELNPGIGEKPVIFHWSGKAWTMAWQLGASAASGIAAGIAAISPTDAWAVGSMCLVLAYHGCSKSGEFTLHWNGKIWHQAG